MLMGWPVRAGLVGHSAILISSRTWRASALRASKKLRVGIGALVSTRFVDLHTTPSPRATSLLPRPTPTPTAFHPRRSPRHPGTIQCNSQLERDHLLRVGRWHGGGPAMPRTNLCSPLDENVGFSSPRGWLIVSPLRADIVPCGPCPGMAQRKDPNKSDLLETGEQVPCV